jgi:glutamate N-acetyltransferase/amino-acid N-acetyltransferase
MSKVSPLAPKKFPEMKPLAGVRLAAGACGLRYKGRTDLMLVELAPETTVAGVFTKSLTASAPVDWCRSALKGGHARALVVNSGNANAFTGKFGIAGVEETVEAAADALPCRPSTVFGASTGVIGEPLPTGKISAALPGLREALADDEWAAAAGAIMTTDTYDKGSTRTAKIGDATVTINGFAKGSGMIAPDMATMLGFIFTDATIPAGVLQEILAPINERSFNSITVDSDTSTSDTVLLFATGAGADHEAVSTVADPQLKDFREKLEEVMLDLAHQIVRDGEGASKFVTVKITGAESARAARIIGLSVANSPLVKTAIAGEDANWGRIVMAVGKAGQRADRDKLAINVGGTQVTEFGGAVDGFDEAPIAEHMKGQEINISIDVGIGNGEATVWTCDLTHEYISINADYRS